MTLPDQETGELPDDVLESVITRAGTSRMFAFERELAAAADCPTEFELRELARGAIEVKTRRVALARHLVTCPNCLERNLAVLGNESHAEFSQPAGQATGPARRLAPRLFLATAALVLCAVWLRSGVGPAPASPIASARGTDRYGFEDRSSGEFDDVVPRRTVVEMKRGGSLALAVLEGTTARLENVDGAKRTVAVRSGEEVLLPLDRALLCKKGDVWLVIHSDLAIDEARLADALPELARGYEVTGFTATRVVPRSR